MSGRGERGNCPTAGRGGGRFHGRQCNNHPHKGKQDERSHYLTIVII